MVPHITLMGTRDSEDFGEARESLKRVGIKVTEMDFRESVASAYLFKDLGVKEIDLLLVNGEYTISGLPEIIKFAERYAGR